MGRNGLARELRSSLNRAAEYEPRRLRALVEVEISARLGHTTTAETERHYIRTPAKAKPLR
jgi:hypothetical protein